MGLESFCVVKFDLWHLLQGQMRVIKLKSAYNLKKCCSSSKLCYLPFSGGYILHLATDASLVQFSLTAEAELPYLYPPEASGGYFGLAFTPPPPSHRHL